MVAPVRKLFCAVVFLVAFIFAGGWFFSGFFNSIPEDALHIKVTAFKWYWEFDYGNGIQTQELTIPVGRSVLLDITSGDVIHSFAIANYEIEQVINPGEKTTVLFSVEERGLTQVSCNVLCGEGHHDMIANVKAVSVADFDAWYKDAKTEAEW